MKNEISRKHAEIYYEAGRFHVRDMGSRNGTYLNGARVVDSKPLASGDRIDIGPSEVTFCEIDESAANSLAANTDGASTVLFERPLACGEAFQGNLAALPTFALLQMLELGCKTGLLALNTAAGPAKIWFENGAPIHAETEKSVGADAALAVINASEGDFRFDNEPVEIEPTIRASITELLLEACRLQDEADDSR